MRYFHLQSDPLRLTGSLEQTSGPPVYRLSRGELYNAKPDMAPFRFSCAGELCDYYSGDCLMARALVETLHGAGVDNLQVFPAALTDDNTGTVREDYCVVNIVGKVAAADMRQSQAISLGGGQVFTRLAVDPGRARDLLIFRLGESLVDVIVHEKVAKAVAAGGFRAVVLSPVTAE